MDVSGLNISRIEALNFRCLRYITQDLEQFHVLLGPNASGKTTFLDVIAFLGKLMKDGLDAAIEERVESFSDLLWKREGNEFELAVEAIIPQERQQLITLKGQNFNTIRYEIKIGLDEEGAASILSEKGMLFSSHETLFPSYRYEFPAPQTPVPTLSKRPKHARTIFSKTLKGMDKYYSEVAKSAGQSGWFPSIELGPKRSTLGSLPHAEKRFPAMTWLRTLLLEGVQTITLNSLEMRRPSPPGRGNRFLPDGSNLPWVVDALKTKDPERFKDWIRHLQTALPDIVDVRVVTRDEDRHKYLNIEYSNGVLVPSWTASDGTLRLLALTLLAYANDIAGVYLIEEPENGIHPRAVETMLDSLKSVYDAQVLLATHSPVVLNQSSPESILCFAKNLEGATDIVRGDHHPRLAQWQSESSLGVLFAAGVLS